jgi:uncharacterized protein (DUF433 family)
MARAPVDRPGTAHAARNPGKSRTGQEAASSGPPGLLSAMLSKSMQAFETKPAPLSRGPDEAIRISGTRVSLETIVSAFDAGATAEEIVQQYPSLELSAAYAVISYVLDHRAEVDAYVAKRFDAARAVQGKIEGHSPPQGVRARLLARRPTPQAR